MAKSKGYKAFCLTCIVTCCALVLQVQQESDYGVHANIIYRFTKYIDWPGNKKSGDFVIGIVGESPMNDYLKKIVANKTAGSQNFYAQWGSLVTNDSGKTYQSYWLHLPNTNLKPITSEIWELNVSHFVSEKMGITFDAYTSVTSGLHAVADNNTTTHIYNNRFNDIPVSYIEVFINQGQQKTHGGSLGLNYKNTVG